MIPLPSPRLARHAMAAALGAVLVAVARPATAVAQSRATHAHPLVVRVGGMRGVSVCLCVNDAEPAPRDRDLYLMSVGTEWSLASGTHVRLSYAADVLPLIVSRNTADSALRVWSCGNRHYCGASSNAYPWTTGAVGAGVLPIGFVARAALTPRLALRARLSGGAVYLSQPVPVMESRNFNFIAELAGGAELRVSHALSLSAGLTQNHISNGNTAPVNLGMDTRLVELGFVVATR